MNDEHLRYWLEIGGTRHPVREARGTEAISTLFRIEIVVTVEGEPPSPADLVDGPAELTLERKGIRERTIAGIATQVRVVFAPGGGSELRVVLEPKMVLARYRTDLRIYRDKSVPTIVTEALSRIGVVPELRLRGSYPERPYCVQYRETDENFVRRLLEDEGIFFYFLEGRLILGDDASAYEPIPAPALLPFADGSGLDTDEDAVVEIGTRTDVAPSRFSLRDFCTDHPSLDMDVTARGPWDGGPEHYDYPGEYQLPPEGRRRARLMAEASECQTQVIHGRSFCARLGPGQTFTLAGAPVDAPEGELAVTKVVHDFRLTASGFSNAFEALPAEETFRPARVTPVPYVTGPQTGIVTGPAGEDIHTDAYGRVKVHMHWDRQQPFDDRCSDWVPVLQENTGSSCAIPRIGWEVLVHFLEGDPDRPVVMGRVWNGEDELPFYLPLNKTWTHMRSYSSPRGKTMGETGNNLFEFRDTAGLEEIISQAERDQRVNVANDKSTIVGNGESASIYRDEAWTVGAMLDVKTGNDLATQVSRNQSVTVGGNRTAKAGIDDNATVTGNRLLSIGGMHFRKIGDADAVNAKNIVEQVGGVIVEASLGSNTSRAEKNAKVTVGGAIIELAGGNKTITSKKVRIETIGGIALSKAKEEVTLGSKQVRRTMVGGALKISSGKNLQLGAKKKVTVTCPMEHLLGKKEVTLKVGETEVVIKDTQVKIKTAKEILIDVTGPSNVCADGSIQI